MQTPEESTKAAATIETALCLNFAAFVFLITVAELMPASRPGAWVRIVLGQREATLYPLLFFRCRLLINEPDAEAGELVYDFSGWSVAIESLQQWDGTNDDLVFERGYRRL